MDPQTLSRSEDVVIEDAQDQYEDRYTEIWNTYVVDKKQREANYKDILVKMLRDNSCKRVLDACCGNGIDSMMLLDEGFEVVSVDIAEGMVKLARRAKAEKKNKPGYDKWVIEQANWVTLKNDLKHVIGDGFDAVMCIGNGLPHILNTHGDFREQKIALKNFYDCIKPGGILLIDHKNTDHVTYGGETPSNSFFFSNKYYKEIKVSVENKNGKPYTVSFDYAIKLNGESEIADVRITLHPYTLDEFTKLVDEAFQGPTKHEIYGDMRPLGEVPYPGFYAHLLQKKA